MFFIIKLLILSNLQINIITLEGQHIKLLSTNFVPAILL